ncbi:SDR family oxidoreductase [Priestia megaterium]|uniref:SDR family oxidoreductase n=1 Tax=Priestia megaterium TaxID=1404 RepID=UPI002E1CF275|nr:SDR family oxidoreductase [Priestia megaterium]MED4290429.1 SDR family oxidoreductase [Priestia megaterium]MED4294697.1 SDR family oxidoreductase [Priestia megaterium]
MKVLVIGANGQVGKHIVNILNESDVHTVRAMVRKEEQAKELEARGIETAFASLEGTVHEIKEVMKSCDAVIFSAGSGGNTGHDKTLLIDLDGAVKAMEAAEDLGIKRFVMVSALQAHHRENWNTSLIPYYVAKHYADKILEASGLTYTIIRPGGLLNEPGTGRVDAGENKERGSIPREDVARVVVETLSEDHTFGRSFDLVSGDTPIAEAIQSI